MLKKFVLSIPLLYLFANVVIYFVQLGNYSSLYALMGVVQVLFLLVSGFFWVKDYSRLYFASILIYLLLAEATVFNLRMLVAKLYYLTSSGVKIYIGERYAHYGLLLLLFSYIIYRSLNKLNEDVSD